MAEITSKFASVPKHPGSAPEREEVQLQSPAVVKTERSIQTAPTEDVVVVDPAAKDSTDQQSEEAKPSEEYTRKDQDSTDSSSEEAKPPQRTRHDRTDDGWSDPDVGRGLKISTKQLNGIKPKIGFKLPGELSYENIDYYLAKYKFFSMRDGHKYGILFMVVIGMVSALLTIFKMSYSTENPNIKMALCFAGIIFSIPTIMLWVSAVEDFRVMEDIIRSNRKRQYLRLQTEKSNS